MWPPMRMPGSTREGKLDAPIDPGARWNIEPCDAFAAAEMMALHHAREAAALADADHVHLFLGLELIHQHFVAGLQIVVAGAQRGTRA